MKKKTSISFYNRFSMYYYYVIGFAFWFIGLLIYYLAYYFHQFQIPAYPLFLGCLIINLVFIENNIEFIKCDYPYYKILKLKVKRWFRK